MKISSRILLMPLLLGCLPMAAMAMPVPLAEVEPNDTLSTAQVLSPGLFTDPATNPALAFDSEVFLSLTRPHVSIDGSLGSPADVDFYRFAVQAGTKGLFDIDHGFASGQSIDTSLLLFDPAGAVLAWGTGACDGACIGPVVLDPGSADYRDPFIGEYTFAAAGDYLLAVVADGVGPSPTGTFAGTLTRTDGEYGGGAYLPNAGPAMLAGTPTPTSGGDYRLQVTLSAPAAVAEPSMVVLMVSLMLLMLGRVVLRCPRDGRTPSLRPVRI